MEAVHAGLGPNMIKGGFCAGGLTGTCGATVQGGLVDMAREQLVNAALPPLQCSEVMKLVSVGTTQAVYN